MSSSKLAIVAFNLKKSYGRRVALRGFDLQVERGTICGLLGPNGAGKTTALRTALGFLKPDEGQVHALGLDCWKQSLALRSRLGYLSADMRFYPWLSARQGLELSSRFQGRALTQRGLELAERLALEPELPAGQMSRGNLQKLGLVLALAGSPELLILDEPSSGLDPLIQQTFAELLLEAQSQGATVLLSSHTFSEVARLCQTVAVVKQGQVVASEPLSTFRARAGRQVSLTFSLSPTSDPPAGLLVEHRSELVWRGRWIGHTGPLLAWCAAEQVADAEISAPVLDDAFLELYR